MAWAPTRASLFVEEAPHFTERAGVFHCTFTSGGEVFAAVCSPHTLLVTIERAQAAYDEWAGRNREAQRLHSRQG